MGDAESAPSGRADGRLILMYHRVASAATDPLELCVAPERFAEHLELLESLGRIVPLRDFARAKGNGLTVAITFDDGYADNVLAAAPLLEQHDAPATVFVVAGAVGSPRAFWWDTGRGGRAPEYFGLGAPPRPSRADRGGVGGARCPLRRRTAGR